ncbi:MAG: hypothetical protein IJ308_08305 [Clostridia bacterium]|nr:hypothetical protein [Clostridia bacterium]MBQ7913720.1 hypothetical protein [Clostridia bacterium]
MKVKEVVLAAAKLLEIDEEVSAYVNEGAGRGKEDAEKLVSCFNLIENDLALNYVSLFEKTLFSVEDGKIFYENFPQNPLRVISVTDKKGERLPFQLFPTEIHVDTGEQEVWVNYAYLPEEKGLLSDSDYQACVSVALMAYGVAAEYCATRGLYTEAAFWGNKYKESIAKSHALKRGGRMQSRKWV